MHAAVPSCGIRVVVQARSWSCSVCLVSMAADPDIGDQLTFAITGGNDAGVFKIAVCRGQIRVALDVLDYFVGPRLYNWTVTATDDGLPAALSASAFFLINVVRVCACAHVLAP